MTSILMVTKYYPPFSSGGTEKYVEVISQKLAEKGLTITIAAPSTTSKTTTEQNGKITIHRFPIHKHSYFEYSSHMRKYIKNSQNDIIHFHTFDVLCRYLRIGLKTPYAITTHGFLWTNHPHNPINYIYKNNILKTNLQHAQRIFCVSQQDHQNIKTLLGNQALNLRYIPNGVDTKKFANLNKTQLKQKNNLQNKTVITQVARFTPLKGQHILIEAIRQLPQETRKQCAFILAGYTHDPTYLNQLKQTIQQNNLQQTIQIQTNPPDIQLTELYGATDIFVLPSFIEGLPLTLFEAWAAKCAVIITNVGGIPYVANNNHDSIVIPPNDPTTLAQKIQQLAADEKTRTELATKGYQRAQTEFNLDRIVDKLVQEYNQILKN
jgi:glycosyltransferase involved in cell wall biosynthesis